MKLILYWLDTSEPSRSATAGPVQSSCDVAVIGGGLTGCSAALALAKKGARVVLLEAETIGHAASAPRPTTGCPLGGRPLRRSQSELGREKRRDSEGHPARRVP